MGCDITIMGFNITLMDLNTIPWAGLQLVHGHQGSFLGKFLRGVGEQNKENEMFGRQATTPEDVSFINPQIKIM